MATEFQNHSKHSNLVRFWKQGVKAAPINPFGCDWEEAKESHRLRSPYSGYLVQVSFSTYPEHPEYVRIRSTNWRCEHEPSGIFHKQDARRFYRELKSAGFVVPEAGRA